MNQDQTPTDLESFDEKKQQRSSMTTHEQKQQQQQQQEVDGKLRCWPHRLTNESVVTTDSTPPRPSSSSPSSIKLPILSFNILAESYLTLRSHPNLPSSDLVFDPLKRRSLLTKTLTKFTMLGYEVICLQEVDMFEDLIEEHMKLLGYDGIITKREGRVDGCAIFWRRSVWTLVADDTIKFDDLATEVDDDSVPLSSKPRDDINRKRQYRKNRRPSELTGMVQSFLRTNVACLAVLRHIWSDETVVVSSAHLYWNPGYEYVKLAQAKYLLDRIHSFAELHSTGDRIPVLVCGDMNSKPGSIVHRFFLEKDGVDARRVAPWHSFYDDEEEEKYEECNPVAVPDMGKLNIGEQTSPIAYPPKSNGQKLAQHYVIHPMSSTSRAIRILPQIKYLLDYSLNRFCRWLRMLGIDAALETLEEEKIRTKSKVPRIILFERCRAEKRTLLTTSYKLLQRKTCPPGGYLIHPTKDPEQTLCHLLLTHGVTLYPSNFLSRCVVCNGTIHPVYDDEQRMDIFKNYNTPNLPNLMVWRCQGCNQGYWWSDQPNSSASRVFDKVQRLFRVVLRANVPVDETDLGMFDFINVVEERAIGVNGENSDDPDSKSEKATKMMNMTALDWIRSDSLDHPFHLASAYGNTGDGNKFGEILPFTNVTDDFVGALDYIFYEPKDWIMTERLHVPTSFPEMNVKKIKNGHLIPSQDWPSDHLAIGCVMKLCRQRRNTIIEPQESIAEQDTTIPSLPHRDRCACGCVPKNIFSLFEMAEMRKHYRAAMEKKKLEGGTDDDP